MAKAEAPKSPKAPKVETGIFPAVDFNGRPKLVRDKPGEELRLRSIKDGSVFGYLMDGYDREGRPNQAQAQLIRTASLRTKVAGVVVPVYYLDEGSKPVSLSLGKGLPNYDIPVLTADLRKAIKDNQAARAAAKSGQEAVVDANLKKADDKDGDS